MKIHRHSVNNNTRAFLSLPTNSHFLNEVVYMKNFYGKHSVGSAIVRGHARTHTQADMTLIAVTLVPTRGANRTKNRAADNGNTEFRTIRTEARLLFLYPVLR